jgi:hypothetical protein
MILFGVTPEAPESIAQNETQNAIHADR